MAVATGVAALVTNDVLLHHRSTAIEVVSGRPRQRMVASSSRATRSPDSEVISVRHSRV